MKARPTKKTHQGDVRIDRRSRNGGLECIDSMKSLADMLAQIGKESEENRRKTMMKKDRRPVREGRIKTEADTVKFLVKLKSASNALLDLSAAWNNLKDEEVLSEVDRYYDLHIPDEHSFISRPRRSFDEFAYDFLSFTQPVLDKFVSGSLDEATAPEFERLGRYVKGMATPGSSRVSDEMFELVDRENGVHERSLVKFFRGQGQLTTISEEDIMEIEDLIEKAWQAGRVARKMRDTGVSRDTSFRARESFKRRSRS